MKRFYVARMIDVTYPETGETRRLPSIWQDVPAWVAVTCQDWALVLADGPDHTAAVANPQAFPLWDITLDTPLSVYKNPERRRVETALRNQGLTVTINWSQDTFRDLLQQIGTQCEGVFDTNRFDLADPT